MTPIDSLSRIQSKPGLATFVSHKGANPCDSSHKIKVATGDWGEIVNHFQEVVETESIILLVVGGCFSDLFLPSRGERGRFSAPFLARSTASQCQKGCTSLSTNTNGC